MNVYESYRYEVERKIGDSFSISWKGDIFCPISSSDRIIYIPYIIPDSSDHILKPGTKSLNISFIKEM